MQGNQFLFTTEKIEDCRTGRPQIISNIEVVEKVAKFMSTTLGPYGLDKLFYGDKLLITNDGATILENMEFTHPIAKLLASLSKSQDNEVGDGTTSVILLTSAILSSLKSLIKDKYDTELIIKCMKTAESKCLNELDELIVEFNENNLKNLAETCMTSKNIRNDRSYFSELLIRALEVESEIHVEKIDGGALSDSLMVDGVAFEKTFTYAGYDQQPKKIENPKILCTSIELEWKAEKENAELRISDVSEYQKICNAEYEILDRKLEAILKSGAKVVLSSQSIGDYATQFFAKKGVFSAGRVHELNRMIKAFGGKIATSTKYLELGKADLFEEKQLGNKRFNYFSSAKSRSKTMILRGPGEQVIEEVERSLHDAVCVIKKAKSSKKIVTGGGSVEMEMSKVCRKLSFNSHDESKFIYRALAQAFEKIPAQLAENFGKDPILSLQKLRMMHEKEKYAGILFSGMTNMLDIGIFEPLDVKKNMIKAAITAAEIILKVDATIINQK
ncbi:hypothetical protein NUSPORA_00086 [Nucleospora cyclopteri]